MYPSNIQFLLYDQLNVNNSRTSSELSASASVFVPGQFDSPDEKAEEEGEPQSQSVSLLYDAMYQLNLELDRFDSMARKLTI